MTDCTFASFLENGLLLRVYVQPGAKESAFCGTRDAEGDCRIKIKLKQRAVDGQANAALIAFLAAQFKLPKSAVRLQAGSTSRLKTVLVTGDCETLLSTLKSLERLWDLEITD